MPISFIDIHTHRQHSDREYILSYSIGRDPAPVFGNIAVSAGVHPWDAESDNVDNALVFLKNAPIVAVGEIGLDFASSADREKQVDIFESQLAVAEQRKLPVIIHCVRAYNEVLNILKKYNLKAVIFHSYIGSIQQTSNIIKRGYYFSISEVSLKSNKSIESLRGIPVDRIFAESDTSDIPIEVIYHKIAEIKNLDIETIAREIDINFKRIFS